MQERTLTMPSPKDVALPFNPSEDDPLVVIERMKERMKQAVKDQADAKLREIEDKFAGPRSKALASADLTKSVIPGIFKDVDYVEATQVLLNLRGKMNRSEAYKQLIAGGCRVGGSRPETNWRISTGNMRDRFVIDKQDDTIALNPSYTQDLSSKYKSAPKKKKRKP